MDELERISCSDFKIAPKIPVLVILDNIRSMNNVGSIFRTCDAFAVEKIYLCGITAKPPHKEITKTALGATESVEWGYEENVGDLVVRLQKENVKVYLIEQTDNSVSLNNFQFPTISKSQSQCLELCGLKSPSGDLGVTTSPSGDLGVAQAPLGDLGVKVAFVLGNEVFGVDDKLLPICDGVIEIPQKGTKHSLNVTIAAGIVLWEAFKNYEF